jgi:methyl-accepting chemotaxis protein
MSTASTAKKDMSQAADKAKDAMGHVSDAVTHAASAVGQTASNVASAVGNRVDQGVSAAGSGMQSLADTARKNLPHDGYLGAASKAVADGLDTAGKYVEDKSLSGMTGDLGSLIKNHPIPAVLIGLGIGYLLGKALRS